MKMPKASRGATVSFEELISGHPELERKQMFGQPVAFIHGNMCIGVFGDRLFLRLSEEDREIMRTAHGAVSFEPMKGRPMMEYVEIPKGILDDPKEAARWLARGLAFAGGLPAKAPKVKKTRR
jgi:TfoX/Sxy family transcriptional regulator of competence genes